MLCTELAQMIAANPLPLSHHKLYTLAFQAESAKELAMSVWPARRRQSPRQSQVYLALPPKKKRETSVNPQKRYWRLPARLCHPLPSGHRTCLYLLIRRQIPSLQANQLSGIRANPQTVAHVIKYSLGYTRARAAHLSQIAPGSSLSTLFNTEGGKALLAFLKASKACFKPLEVAFDPG
jgi:hypothetical protein